VNAFFQHAHYIKSGSKAQRMTLVLDIAQVILSAVLVVLVWKLYKGK
jgi:succinate dehydrogenase/fumarate reductase cytochrome b subunit